MAGRDDLIQQNRSRGRTSTTQSQGTAPGIPQPPSATSGNTSSGSPQNTSGETGGNRTPFVRVYGTIREKLLRPALTSHYECIFNAPGPVQTWFTQKGLNYGLNLDLLTLSCSEASLPGSSFMTNEIIDDHTGVTERYAYRRSYDDRADFTFYVDHGRDDGNYNILWFFEKWMQYIANEQDARGLRTRSFYHRVRYPDDYTTDELYINKFERDAGSQYLRYQFMQAYPVSINSMPVSYESSDLLKCTVSFSYTRYITERVQLSSGGVKPNPIAPGVPELASPNSLPNVGNINQNLPVIGDVDGNDFPIGPGIPGLTGNLNPTIA
jgi:hypothetical protein